MSWTFASLFHAAHIYPVAGYPATATTGDVVDHHRNHDSFRLHAGPVLGFLGPRARLKIGTLNIAITIIFIDIRKK
jgi:hypothetical protein